MKSLTFKLVLPLTIISFGTLTQWWYTLPVDAPDTMFNGFPFPFVCEGWHTSMSLQIFVTEFIADLLTYFLFWFILAFCINRFVAQLKIHKAFTVCLWTLSGFIIAFATVLAANKDNLFYVKRPFKMEIMETGFQFSWQHVERPDYKYHPEARRQ